MTLGSMYVYTIKLHGTFGQIALQLWGFDGRSRQAPEVALLDPYSGSLSVPGFRL